MAKTLAAMYHGRIKYPSDSATSGPLSAPQPPSTSVAS